jgi:hypothetical protein
MNRIVRVLLPLSLSSHLALRAGFGRNRIDWPGPRSDSPFIDMADRMIHPMERVALGVGRATGTVMFQPFTEPGRDN